MNEQMEFPKTFEEFAKEYGFKDNKEVYTNGSDLIPIFRVKQWLEKQIQQPCEDTISREAVLSLQTKYAEEIGATTFWKLRDDIQKLLPVTPQIEPKWTLVSERLPEKRGHYFTTVKIEIPDLNKLCYETRIAGFDGTYFNIGYIGDDVSIIAWMPLPQPYREESEDKI